MFKSILVSVALAFVSGCVERTLTVQSNPPGALVYLNDQEVGRTPLKRDFTWYGTYDVAVRKEGYRSIKTHASIIAPAYEFVPLDLVAELLPFKIIDGRTLSYDLETDTPTPGEADTLVLHAQEMRSALESSQYTRTRTVPQTQPSTIPSR